MVFLKGRKFLICIKIALFMSMFMLFIWQSVDNFNKWLQNYTSINEYYHPADPEPLPTFSICANPPFDNAYLKQSLNLSSALFLPTFNFKLNSFIEESPFPSFVSPQGNETNLLDLWEHSSLLPKNFSIESDEGLEIETVELGSDAQNYSELAYYDIMHSPWYGKCASFVLKKPKKANERLFLTMTSLRCFESVQFLFLK